MAGDELLLAGIRWLHGLAAVAWIGTIFYELIVLVPRVMEELPPATRGRIESGRREIEQASLIAFLITGAVLTFDRLSRTGADPRYVATLGLKIVLAVAMFLVAGRARRAAGDQRVRALRWQAALGATIVFLAAVLKSLFERATA